MLMSIQELQERHVLRVLEHVRGNKAQAAEILGVSRGTIYQLLANAKAGNGN
jgi:two-component system NtrC family response regulator